MRATGETCRGGIARVALAAAAVVCALAAASSVAAESPPWPKTKPPQRIWQAVLDGSELDPVLFDVAADGSAVVGETRATDGKRIIAFTWLDRDGAIRRRATVAEAVIGSPQWIALQPDGRILLATLRARDTSFGELHMVALDLSANVAYDRLPWLPPQPPGGAVFPGFARAPLASADGGALFAPSLSNPAPAYGFYLERMDATGRSIWRARFDAGLQRGRSHQLLDLRFLGGGEVALLYVRDQAFALRRYGLQGAPAGAVTVFGSAVKDRDIACGAVLDARTIVTLEGPGAEFVTDTKLFVLAWHGAGKGKLREQRLVLDQARPANCRLFAMDAGGAVLSEAGLGVVRLDAKGTALWSLERTTDLRAAPGMVTTLDAAGEGEARRLTVTRYADKAAD